MKTLAFDFDGTLTRRDTVAGFYRALCPSRRRRWPGTARVAWSIALSRVGLSDPDAVKAAGFRRFVRGRGQAELREAAARFVAGVPTHSSVVARLDRALAEGDRVLIVSASFDVVVAAFRPTAEIVATEVRFRDDRADTMGPHLVGPRKVEALRSMGVERLDEAWTDSAHDLPLLSLAERRFRVDRDGTIHELRELAPW